MQSRHGHLGHPTQGRFLSKRMLQGTTCIHGREELERRRNGKRRKRMHTSGLLTEGQGGARLTLQHRPKGRPRDQCSCPPSDFPEVPRQDGVSLWKPPSPAASSPPPGRSGAAHLDPDVGGEDSNEHSILNYCSYQKRISGDDFLQTPFLLPGCLAALPYGRSQNSAQSVGDADKSGQALPESVGGGVRPAPVGHPSPWSGCRPGKHSQHCGVVS